MGRSLAATVGPKKFKINRQELIMKNELKNLLIYGKLISSKWILWIFVTLDIAAIIAQVVYPSFQIPQITFVIIILVGLFWAGYQVIKDTSPQLLSSYKEKPPFEILPVSFEIGLDRNIPCVEIIIYFVNYYSRDLFLQLIKITDFSLTGIQGLEDISQSHEITVPSKQTKRITCRRNLNDAEARLIKKNKPSSAPNAMFTVEVHAVAGRKSFRYEFNQISMSGEILSRDE